MENNAAMYINHHKAFLFKCTKIPTSDITCKTLNHFFITNPNICTSLTIRKKHISVHFRKLESDKVKGKSQNSSSNQNLTKSALNHKNHFKKFSF